MKRTNRRSGAVDFITVKEGGTGQASMSAFRTANRIVEKSDPRVIRLDSEARLPVNAIPDNFLGAPMLTMPSAMFNGQSIDLPIKNHDSFISYVVTNKTVDSGTTIAITDKKVHVTVAPDFFEKELKWTINGYDYSVTVQRRNPAKPVASVTALKTGPGISVSVNGSTFQSPFGSTFSKMKVELSSVSDFATLISTTEYTASASKSTISLVDTLYVRITYTDSDGYSSYASDVVALNSSEMGNEVATPVITYKADKDNLKTNLYLRSTPYQAIEGLSATGTLWQVAADTGFSTIIATATTAAGVIDYTPSLTLTSGTVYIRCQHQAAGSKYSQWSATKAVNISEAISILPINETHNFVKGSTDAYISDDGVELIVPDHNYNTNTGIVTHYRKIDSVWTVVQTLTSPSAKQYGRFGSRIVVAPDMSRMAVCAAYIPGFNSGYASEAKVHIYRRENSLWVLETTLSGSSYTVSGASFARFGLSASASSDFSVLAVGSDDSSTNLKAVVAVFKRTGTSWALRDTIVDPSPYPNNSCWARSLEISADGTRLVSCASDIGTTSSPSSGNGGGWFSCHVYNGSAWTYNGGWYLPFNASDIFPNITWKRANLNKIIFSSGTGNSTLSSICYGWNGTTYALLFSLNRSSVDPSPGTRFMRTFNHNVEDSIIYVMDKNATPGKLVALQWVTDTWVPLKTWIAPAGVASIGWPRSVIYSNNGNYMVTLAVSATDAATIVNIYERPILSAAYK